MIFWLFLLYVSLLYYFYSYFEREREREREKKNENRRTTFGLSFDVKKSLRDFERERERVEIFHSYIVLIFIF